MRLPAVLTMVLLGASFLAGQVKVDEPFEAVIIPVKTLSGDSFERLTKMLNVFGAKYSADERLRTILVYAPKHVVAQMRRVVEQLDQPGSEAAIGRNIELTLSFLRCSTAASAGGKALPAELEPVAKQLRAITQYKTVELWDVMPMHIQEGREATQSFRLPGIFADSPESFARGSVRMMPELVTRKDSGRYVRFSRMQITLQVPYKSKSFVGNNAPQIVSTAFMDIGLNTAGDFKEGQKTVLGKLGGLEDDTAVFAVVALKVID